MKQETIVIWEPGQCPDCDGLGIDDNNHECRACHGTGVTAFDVRKEITNLEYETIKERERERNLLRKRYGTPEPTSIADWWQ
jgi:DnaJ-class molecular chaperone